MNIIINPGTGPVDNAREASARRNVGLFIRDLIRGGVDPEAPALGAKPKIRMERRPSQDFEGRYGFVLKRGRCSCEIEMPGKVVDAVRYVSESQNPWHFPRLYVEGNSWLWLFAIRNAYRMLVDHDGELAAAHKRSEADVDFVLANEPRCPTCGSVREGRHDDAPHLFGLQRVRCYTCQPEVWEREVQGVFGARIRVVMRRRAYEATGEPGDRICAKPIWSSGYNVLKCVRREGHDGKCLSMFEEIERGPAPPGWKASENYRLYAVRENQP